MLFPEKIIFYQGDGIFIEAFCSEFGKNFILQVDIYQPIARNK